MPFFESAWTHLKWGLSVTRKLMTVVPLDTLAAVAAAVASWVLQVLSYFMPMKVIILLGSDTVPWYYPQPLRNFSVEQLAIGLSIAAALCYALYLMAGRLANVCAERGARRLLERSRKLALFANQEEIGKRRYHMLVGALAGVIFTALAFFVLFWIYPELATLVVASILGLSVASYGAARAHSGFEEWAGTHFRVLVDTIGALAFLSAFAYMLMDLLVHRDSNLIVALVGLLLARMLMQRLGKMVIDMEVLSRERHAINALFFHGHKFQRASTRSEQVFWKLLEPTRREQEFLEVLQQIADQPIVRVNSAWQQLGAPDVAAFTVTAHDEDQRISQTFFLKLFDVKREGLAAQEVILLDSPGLRDLLAPRLIAAVEVDRFRCLVFEAIPAETPQPKDVGTAVRFVMSRSWTIEPPSELVDRVRRSVPLLVDRLGAETIERLRLTANGRGERAMLGRFESSLEEIKTRLVSLPLYVFNPKVNLDTVRMQNGEVSVVIDWSTWSLEPIGAGWPISEPDMVKLERNLETAGRDSERVATCDPLDARLAALVFAFERLFAGQRYRSAIESLPAVLECLATHTCDTAEETEQADL